MRLPTEGPSDAGVAFSRDGRRLVVSNRDGTASLYDAQTFERHAGFSPIDNGGPGNLESPPHYSHDGSRIVGLSGDVVDGQWTGDVARIWDARTGKELVVLRRHDNVLSATFVGQGDRVMTTGDGMIRFWDAADGLMLVQIRVREVTGAIVFAAASPDGTLVASGSVWNRPGVWDTRTGKSIVKLEGAREDTFVHRFTPDGRYVATGDDTGTVGLWDRRGRRRLCRRALPFHGGRAGRVGVGPLRAPRSAGRGSRGADAAASALRPRHAPHGA